MVNKTEQLSEAYTHIINAIKSLEDINTYYLKDTDIPIDELITSIINSLYVAQYLMDEKIDKELSKKEVNEHE